MSSCASKSCRQKSHRLSYRRKSRLTSYQSTSTRNTSSWPWTIALRIMLPAQRVGMEFKNISAPKENCGWNSYLKPCAKLISYAVAISTLGRIKPFSTPFAQKHAIWKISRTKGRKPSSQNQLQALTNKPKQRRKTTNTCSSVWSMPMEGNSQVIFSFSRDFAKLLTQSSAFFLMLALSPRKTRSIECGRTWRRTASAGEYVGTWGSISKTQLMI